MQVEFIVNNAILLKIFEINLFLEILFDSLASFGGAEATEKELLLHIEGHVDLLLVLEHGQSALELLLFSNFINGIRRDLEADSGFAFVH